eukprot:g28046.t1
MEGLVKLKALKKEWRLWEQYTFSTREIVQEVPSMAVERNFLVSLLLQLTSFPTTLSDWNNYESCAVQELEAGATGTVLDSLAADRAEIPPGEPREVVLECGKMIDAYGLSLIIREPGESRGLVGASVLRVKRLPEGCHISDDMEEPSVQCNVDLDVVMEAGALEAVGYIESIAVARAWRGCGLAYDVDVGDDFVYTAVDWQLDYRVNNIRKMMEEARAWGLRLIALHVHRDNWSALRFYEKKGFEVTSDWLGWGKKFFLLLKPFLLQEQVTEEPSGPPVALAPSEPADEPPAPAEEPPAAVPPAVPEEAKADDNEDCQDDEGGLPEVDFAALRRELAEEKEPAPVRSAPFALFADSASMQGRRPKQEDRLTAGRRLMCPFQWGTLGLQSYLRFDRHVKIPDLTKAAKALKMPIDHLPQPCAFFSVYDGHQGQQCSDFAAKGFHGKLLKRLSADTDPAAWTEERICSTLKEICEAPLRVGIAQELDSEFLQKFRTSPDGTTLVVALVVGTKLYTAWVGDSRLVLCQRSQMQQLLAVAVTKDAIDHRPNLEAEAKRVKDAGGLVLDFGMGVYRVAHDGYEEWPSDCR